ncbi:MAG: Rpn family recombination-promoting nuclease/putative transposase [Desulfobacterales bacterium]
MQLNEFSSHLQEICAVIYRAAKEKIESAVIVLYISIIMTENMTNIHDRFFRETFSRREIASGFLETYLPEEIRSQLRLDTLEIVKDSFVDKELREHYSDITYTVRFRDMRLYLYLLFEHKSFPDPLTGFQLLRYIVRLGEMHFRQNPRSKTFPPVFPMVFYHGRSRWNIPDSFESLTGLREDCPLRTYIPAFRFRVYDILSSAG